jgi:methyl-accepting chemotaxis protein PixJ
MVSPKEVRPDAATTANAGLPALENLTPHPEEFHSLAADVIGALDRERSSSNPERASASSPKMAPGKAMAKQVGLRTKATLAAIALSVLPTLAIGGLAYSFSSNALEEKITTAELTRAQGMAERINVFMAERYGDIQVISKLPFLVNPAVRTVISPEDKQATLENYRKIYGVYSSIAAFDLQGDVIAQSTEGTTLGNQADQDDLKAVLATGKPYIGKPQTDKTSGEVTIDFAAPILDSETDKMIGVVRSRMPMSSFELIINTFSKNGEESHVVSREGVFLAATSKDRVGKELAVGFPELQPLISEKQSGSAIVSDEIDGTEELVAYVPLPVKEGLPELGWSSVIGLDTEIVFASQRQLLTALLLGTAAVAALVALISAYLANQATRPVIQAAEVVERIGLGQLDARLDVAEAGDELVMLGQNINQMGSELKRFLEAQESDARLASMLGDMARLQSTDGLALPLDSILHETQRQMGGDRILFQRITNAQGSSTALAEAVMPHLRRAQGQSLPALPESLLSRLRDEQQPQAYNQITTSDLGQELLNQLQSLQVSP